MSRSDCADAQSDMYILILTFTFCQQLYYIKNSDLLYFFARQAKSEGLILL